MTELKPREHAFLYFAPRIGERVSFVPGEPRLHGLVSDPRPTKRGLKQFKRHQGAGVFPKDPDPFFVALTMGKYNAESYSLCVKADWYGDVNPMMGVDCPWEGWYQVAADLGFNFWLFPLIFGWMKDVDERVRKLKKAVRDEAVEV